MVRASRDTRAEAAGTQPVRPSRPERDQAEGEGREARGEDRGPLGCSGLPDDRRLEGASFVVVPRCLWSTNRTHARTRAGKICEMQPICTHVLYP